MVALACLLSVLAIVTSAVADAGRAKPRQQLGGRVLPMLELGSEAGRKAHRPLGPAGT